jgi:3-methyl-2-oxobutanoate hydroxymethyltransferase
MYDRQTALKKVTVQGLRECKRNGEKFTCLTAYDISFSRLLEEAGIDVILVGDSLGMVIQGEQTTLPVSVDDMVYHSRAVARGCQRALLMVDMPFMSYATVEQALHNAARLMKEGGANILKLEGGAGQVEVVRQLTRQGIPVCAHLGLQPQSVYKLGGYRVQGRDKPTATRMIDDARMLQEAGADILLLECVPTALAAQITQSLDIPVIGIGAGKDCDAQVLVLQDMLGITPGKPPRFSHDFMQGGGSIREAVERYRDAVLSGAFPGPEHTFE